MNVEGQIEQILSPRRRRFKHPLLTLMLAGAAVLGCAVATLRHADTPRQNSPATTPVANNIPGVLRFDLVTENTQVHLRGSTNIGGWSSVTPDIQATISLRTDLSSINALFDQVESGAKPDLPLLPVHLTPPSTLQIAIPVKSFRGDSAGMDRDMQKALKEIEHPDITYALKEVQAISVSDGPQNHRTALAVQALGDLTVAGVQQTCVTNATIYRDSQGHFIVHAEQAQKMSDFGVQPPSALFGLIHAQNSMTVIFDLDLAPDSATPATKSVRTDPNHP